MQEEVPVEAIESMEEHNRNAYLRAFGTLHPTDKKAIDFITMHVPEKAPYQIRRQGGRCFLLSIDRFGKKTTMGCGSDNFSCVVNAHLAYINETTKKKK